MEEMLFGIYRAIVTDISCFEQTGKIKTRISAFNAGSVPKNLVNGYDSSRFSDVITRDILTDIIMPFGGGYDYGMFKLPQVNSVGLVAFVDGDKSFPIWIGSTANSIVDRNNNVVELDFPSDKDNNRPAIYNNGSEAVFNYDDKNAFIIKTKTNKLDDFSKPETMVWANNPVENSFVLSSYKARIYHRINDYEYQEFVMSNDEENKTNSIMFGYVLDEENEDVKKVEIDKDQILIKNKDGDDTAQIIFDKDGGIFINAFSDTGKADETRIDTSIELTSAAINIKAGHSHISMSRNIDNSQEKITISANNIQIDSQNISLGSSGYSLIASPNPNLNFTLQDGSMLTTVSNIRV